VVLFSLGALSARDESDNTIVSKAAVVKGNMLSSGAR
jgi:hypothetical protein